MLYAFRTSGYHITAFKVLICTVRRSTDSYIYIYLFFWCCFFWRSVFLLVRPPIHFQRTVFRTAIDCNCQTSAQHSVSLLSKLHLVPSTILSWCDVTSLLSYLLPLLSSILYIVSRRHAYANSVSSSNCNTPGRAVGVTGAIMMQTTRPAILLAMVAAAEEEEGGEEGGGREGYCRHGTTVSLWSME